MLDLMPQSKITYYCSYTNSGEDLSSLVDSAMYLVHMSCLVIDPQYW